jgi:hypothetical protein
MYMHWAKDCTSRSGIVRVVSKPQHGKLIPSVVDASIKQNRFNLSDTSCVGKTIKGFQVEYQSAPGYRGTDSFTIEATYEKRQALDVYMITVE